MIEILFIYQLVHNSIMSSVRHRLIPLVGRRSFDGDEKGLRKVLFCLLRGLTP